MDRLSFSYKTLTKPPKNKKESTFDLMENLLKDRLSFTRYFVYLFLLPFVKYEFIDITISHITRPQSFYWSLLRESPV